MSSSRTRPRGCPWSDGGGSWGMDLQETRSALGENLSACAISGTKGSESICLPGGFQSRGKMPAKSSQGEDLSPGRLERHTEPRVWTCPCCSSALPRHPPCSRTLPSGSQCAGPPCPSQGTRILQLHLPPGHRGAFGDLPPAACAQPRASCPGGGQRTSCFSCFCSLIQAVRAAGISAVSCTGLCNSSAVSLSPAEWKISTKRMICGCFCSSRSSFLTQR